VDENAANALTDPFRRSAAAYRRIAIMLLLLLLLLLAIVAFKSKIRFAPRDEREMRFNSPQCYCMSGLLGERDSS